MHHKQKSEKRRRWVARKQRTARATRDARRTRALVVFRSAQAHLRAARRPARRAHARQRLDALGVDPRARAARATSRPPSASARRSRRSRAEKQIERVVFNRNGFLYHGRVKALADAAREAGLKF